MLQNSEKKGRALTASSVEDSKVGIHFPKSPAIYALKNLGNSRDSIPTKKLGVEGQVFRDTALYSIFLQHSLTKLK
jgi:hypothetical protein